MYQDIQVLSSVWKYNPVYTQRCVFNPENETLCNSTLVFIVCSQLVFERTHDNREGSFHQTNYKNGLRTSMNQGKGNGCDLNDVLVLATLCARGGAILVVDEAFYIVASQPWHDVFIVNSNVPAWLVRNFALLTIAHCASGSQFVNCPALIRGAQLSCVSRLPWLGCPLFPPHHQEFHVTTSHCQEAAPPLMFLSNCGFEVAAAFPLVLCWDCRSGEVLRLL